MSLRLEKSYGTWFREYRPIYTPLEAGIDALHQARPRVHRPGGARGRGRGRRPGAAAGGVRRRARPGRSGRRHRRRADLARRRGRRLGHLGRLRPPRQGVASRSATCRPRWPTPDGPGGAGSRSRSSAGAGRPGSSPSRCSTRRASGCASDRRLGGRRSPAGRIVVDGRPIAFEPGDSVAVAILRAGEVPGRGGTLCLAGDCGNCLAEVDGVAYVRTCQTPARPGLAVARHPADGDAAAAGRRPPRTSTRPPLGRAIEVRRVEVDVAVIGGGSSGLAAAAAAEAAGRDVLVLDAGAGDEVVAIYAGPTVVARTPTGMLHVDAARDRRRHRRRRDPPGLPGQPPRRARHGPRRRAAPRGGRRPRRGRRRRDAARRRARAARRRARSSGSRATDGRVTRGRDRGPDDRRGDDDAVPTRSSSASASRRATSWPGWPATVPVTRRSATRPPTQPLPPAADRGRRLPLHGHDRRRPRRRPGTAASRELELLKRASLAGLGTVPGRRVPAPRPRRGSPPGPARSRSRSRPARRRARSPSPRPPPTSTSTPSGGRRSTTSTSRSARGWTGSAAGGGRGTTATPWPSTGRSARASRSATSSTLGKLVVSGPDVVELLERLYPCHVADIKPGRSRYALLLNERGHVMDDGMILRESRDPVRAVVHVRRRGQRRDVGPRLDRDLGPARPRPRPDDVARRDQRHRAARRRRCSRAPASPTRRASSATSTPRSPASRATSCACRSPARPPSSSTTRSIGRSSCGARSWTLGADLGDPAARPPGAVRAAAREGPRHRRHGHRARHDAAPARHGLGGPDGEAAVHRPGVARADRQAARPPALGRVHDGRPGPDRGRADLVAAARSSAT